MKTMMTLSKLQTKQTLLFSPDSGISVWPNSANSEQRTNIMQRAIPGSSVKLALMLVALLMALPALRAEAEPASDPAGFYRITCLGNSDTIVSIPFTRPAAANVVVEAVAGNVVTVKGTPGWSEDQFVYLAGSQPNTYYVRFLSGAKEGSYYRVTANDTDSLTLDLEGDAISSVTDGDRAAVIPYWTLGTAFPGGRGVVASTLVFDRKTEVFVPDFTKPGINQGVRATYFYLTTGETGEWRDFNQAGVKKDDEVLLPDVYMIVRHNTAASTVVTVRGSVPVSKLTMPLMTEAAMKQDNFVALTRPAVVTLNDSGLVQSGAFLASITTFNRTDELFVFDNSAVGKNKGPVATYYYFDGAWRKFGSNDDFGNEPVFTPGTGVIIRKNSTAGGVSSFWLNQPGY